MAKTHFICQACGAVHAKWMGQCQGCHDWNTLIEEEIQKKGPGLSSRKGLGQTFSTLTEVVPMPQRLESHLKEWDRILGGGFVPGSVLLMGGDPGIGKSTLLLQIAAEMSTHVFCAYVTGEEALDQIRLRAKRLGVADTPLMLMAETKVDTLLSSLQGLSKEKRPKLLIIDSIQTMMVEAFTSTPGSVSQVRACTHALIQEAKSQGTAVVLVGHVTKDGSLAGPRVLEHMVDAVFYFEGERGHPFRILRSVKNRYGATDEMGVFEMGTKGLQEVLNPSAFFLSERGDGMPGSVVYAGMEGSRPVLMEIQALIAPSSYGTPRRAVVGWDPQRLAMVLAVLETRCGLKLGARDVYLSVVGGLRIQDPGADLAVACALMSAYTQNPAPPGTVFFGEIGLSGEVRSVAHQDKRLKEAAKLGFTKAVTSKKRQEEAYGLSRKTFSFLMDVLPYFKQ